MERGTATTSGKLVTPSRARLWPHQFTRGQVQVVRLVEPLNPVDSDGGLNL